MFLKEKESHSSPMLSAVSRSHLVVIDMQERFATAIPGLANAADRAAILCQAATLCKVPVLVTQQNSKALGETVSVLRDAIPTSAARFEKMCFSAFDLPEAAEEFRAQKRMQFILCGVEAHVCVLQTALDLLENLGAQVMVVRDAVASRRDADRDAAFTRMAAVGVQLVTSEMVAFEWLRKAGNPEFKAIQALIK